MTNPLTSMLPPFLTPEPGLNSGFMIAQVTAAALTSENKALATPHFRGFDFDFGQSGRLRVDGMSERGG